MDKYGMDPNPKVARIPDAERFLLEAYHREWPDLIMLAALDNTKRRNINFVLNYPKISPWGGTVNYCKQSRRFDFIEYSSRGHAKRISLLESDAGESSNQISLNF